MQFPNGYEFGERFRQAKLSDLQGLPRNFDTSARRLAPDAAGLCVLRLLELRNSGRQSDTGT